MEVLDLSGLWFWCEEGVEFLFQVGGFAVFSRRSKAFMVGP
jgi:hypothetical protein